MVRHPAVEATISSHEALGPNADGRYLFALFGEDRLRRILSRMLDEGEFLGPHGIRSLSRYHAEHPYTFEVHGETYGVGYLPAESDSGMFGGNSNWRGPVWFPVNLLLIRALLNLHAFHGPEFTVECPTGSGRQLTLYEVAREISDRLTATFLSDADGHRPVHGAQAKFAKDPHWRDLILFYEYFHGDNGAVPRRLPPDRLDRPVRGHRHPLPHPGRPGVVDAGPREPPPDRRPRGAPVMTAWPEHPVIYEINTLIWLGS